MEPIPHNAIECPECEGKKELVYSCCTGEAVDNDYMMCPICHEYLGEEPCVTCDGKGWIIDEETISETELSEG